MNSQHDVEVRLERSLRHQVAVPSLGKKFDAGVWARIEAEQARAANPLAALEPSREERATRWLAISNSIGIAVTLIVVAVFTWRAFGGVDTAATLEAAVPTLPTFPGMTKDAVGPWIVGFGQMLGIAALAFGLSFTSLGRRIRASLS